MLSCATDLVHVSLSSLIIQICTNLDFLRLVHPDDAVYYDSTIVSIESFYVADPSRDAPAIVGIKECRHEITDFLPEYGNISADDDIILPFVERVSRYKFCATN